MKQEIIRLWSACNQECLFCNQEEVFEKKSKKQILYELISFKRKWVERLVISWWEPTIFKEELYFTIITWKSLGFRDIEIQSNAVLLSNYAYAKYLFDVGLNSSMISLHYFEGIVSDDLTQRKWTFAKTVSWINNLVKAWVKTSLNIVINRRNYTNILEYLYFINTHIVWFDNISLSIVVPWELTIKNDLLPRYSELSRYLIEAYDYCIQYNIDFQNPWCWIPVCFIKDYARYSLEYQNLINKNKYDEFILEKNSPAKIKSEACEKCIFNNYCLWLWRWYVGLYWFDEVKPIVNM